MGGQAIVLLTEEELKEQFTNHLSELLSTPEILPAVRLKLLDLPLAERSRLAGQWKNLLEHNNQSIGTVLMSKKGLRLPPTLANWLKDFIDFVGRDFSGEKRAAYLKTGDMAGLEAADKENLATLFDFYEFLAATEKNPAGLDAVLIKDQSGRLKIWQADRLVDFSPEKGLQPVTSVSEPLPSPAPVKENKPEAENLIPMPDKNTASSYLLHPDDEQEIKNHTDNLSQYQLPETYGVEEIMAKIIKRYQLVFDDDILRKRFASIATARLKEIRNEADTLDLLTRSTKIGGLAFLPEIAQKIAEDLNTEIPHLQQVKTSEIPTPSLPPTPQEALKETLSKEKVFSAMISPEITPAEQPITEPVLAEKNIEPKEAPVPPVSTQDALFERARQQLEQETQRKESQAEEWAARPVMNRPPTDSQKPRLEDIKSKAKIYGPIEELKAMSLLDFRRLGTPKVSSAQKVYDKIILLKEDSFAKFAAGLKAWRASEVYQQYLAMGMDSMENGKTIREVIENRSSQGLPYLSEQEFYLIVDINRKLRY